MDRETLQPLARVFGATCDEMTIRSHGGFRDAFWLF